MTISYSPLPTLLGVTPHGLFAMLGIIAGAVLLRRQVRARGADVEITDNALIWAIPAAIIGARLDYIVSHPSAFSSPLEMLEIWRGGLALFGGLIAGLGVGSLVAYRGGFHLPRLLDVAAPSIALAVAIGRIGDLLLLDHLGKPTHSGLALAYRIRLGTQLAPGYEPSPAVYPPVGATCRDAGSFYAGCSYQLTAAYDLVGALLLFVLLMLLRRTAYPSGLAISLWAFWYGTQRFALDFLRGIDERPLLGMTGTQILAVVLASGGLALTVALALRSRRRTSGEPTDVSMQLPLQRAPSNIDQP